MRDLRAELLDPLAGDRRDRARRRALERGVDGEDLDLLAHLGEAWRVDEIRLGDDHDAALHAEQMQDVEMLFGLRHHAVVGGDDE